MKKNIFIILLLITAFSFLTSCSKNPDSPPSEASVGQLPPPSSAPSVPAESVASESYYIVEKNGRQGVVNGRGQVVLPFKYSKIDILYYGETPAALFAVPAAVKTDGQKSSYHGLFYEGLLFNLNGSLIYKGKCRFANPISDGLIELYGDEKCGVISYDGKEVIPFRYNSISLCDDYIVAAAGDFYSSLDKTADVDVYGKDGRLQNSGKLSFVGTGGSLIIVSDDTGAKYGLMDIRFEEVVPAEWDQLYSVGNGFFIVCRGGKYGVLNSCGKEIVPAEFNYLDRCGDPGGPASMIFSASDEDGIYVYDQDGKRLFFSDKHTYIFIQNGVMIAQDRSNMSHYLNQEGKDIVPPAESISADASGLIVCYNSGVCACYTKDGVKLPLPETGTISIISPERFIFASKINWLYGICDAGGEIIVPAKYTYMFSCGENNDLAVFTEMDRPEKAHYGVIDPGNGRILLNGFDMLQYAGSGLFYAQKGSVHGLIDTSGSWIWQASDYQTLMD